MTPDAFNRRFKSASSHKKHAWENHLREAMQLFCPNREGFYRHVDGQKKGIDVYTSAPYIAMDKASNNIHSSYTPPQRKFTELTPGINVPKEMRTRALEDLQAINNTLFSYIFSSNFDMAISEFYKDLLIGTAALLIQGTRETPLYFTCVPLDQLYFLEGANGVVDTVFRKYKIALRNIEATWDDAQISADLKVQIKESPDKEVTIIEGTIPKKVTVFDPQTDKDVEVNGFGYYVTIEKQSGYLVERELTYNPWVVARWSTLSGEIWGRGPAIVALNDAKTLNQFIKLHMQGLEITVHPVFTVVDDGIINVQNMRIQPGTTIPVSANDGVFGPSIKQLTSNRDMQASQIEMARLEQSINDQMYTEPLGRVTLPVKTATEISMRQQELSKRIGSAYGRLNHEFRNPFINACLAVLDANQFINMNKYKVDGRIIDIESVSPLAQMQQQDEINNLFAAVEFAANLYGPQVAAAFYPPDKVLPYLSQELNLATEVTNTPEQVKDATAKIAQAAMQQTEMTNG